MATSPTLCDFCVKLTRWIASSDRYPAGDLGEESCEILKEFAITCDMCESIMEDKRALDKDLQLEFPRQVPLNFDVTCKASQMSEENGRICIVEIRCENVQVPWCFAVWAEKGSPANDKFTSCAPIVGPSIGQACQLTQNWLDDCALHDDCVVIRDEVLPTRVLSISGTESSLAVKLVEANGMKARYCALSHCWGPTTQLPLRTTRQNLEQRLIDIPLVQLPRTFHEAILFLHGLGIQYFWIDSLCIIQDDADDWDTESGKMHLVYRNAALVISAAGASNSTDGLFITDRPNVVVHKIPYSKGKPSGYVNMCILPSGQFTEPRYGPLYSRAWVLQERHFAQRMVSFMPQAMFWRCNSVELQEGGQDPDQFSMESFSWYDLLESYTRKQIKYATDRLHALRGITTDMQTTRTDHYYGKYGVWKDTLHGDLLWRQDGPTSEEGKLPLPSWSWAATDGPKSWCTVSLEAPQKMPQSLEIGPGGHIVSSGYLTKPTVAFKAKGWNYLDGLEPGNFEMFFVSRYDPLDYKQYSGDSGQAFDNMLYLILDQDTTQTPMGFAVFDDRDIVSNVQAFLVASIYRSENDLDASEMSSNTSYTSSLSAGSSLIPIEPNETPQPQPDQVGNHKKRKASAASLDSNFQQASEEYWNDLPGVKSPKFPDQNYKLIEQLEQSQHSDFVYWALLLDPIGEGKFKRVGLAMLYPFAMQALGAEVVDVEIV